MRFDLLSYVKSRNTQFCNEMREFQPFKKSLSFLSNMLFLQNITGFNFVRIISENFHKNIAHSIYDKIHSTCRKKT